MKPRQKRFVLIGLGLVALALAATLVLNAFQSNLVFFFTPTQVANGDVPHGRSFRIGGMVEKGSLMREGDGLTVHFIVTDMAKRVPVTLKDSSASSRKGRGEVAQGQLELMDIRGEVWRTMVKQLMRGAGQGGGHRAATLVVKPY
jgi:cytochrome c-type biogenesis protein CcmE